MYRLKYINQEIFWTTFGFIFSFPTIGDIFLEYIAPAITNSSIPTISLIISIISILVFLSSWITLFDVINKYHKMRGVITDNHIRNMIIAIVLGILFGFIVRAIIF